MRRIVEGAAEKLCPKCEKWKRLDCFYPSGTRGKLQGYCKPCTVINNRGRTYPRERSSNYKRNHTLKKKYGITLDDWKRMFNAQGQRCLICDSEVTTNPYGTFEVDHDHNTGKVRGILCRRCNNDTARYECFLTSPVKELIVTYVEQHNVP